MNRYEQRRRLAPVVWFFVVLLALPPGLLTSRAHATGAWNNSLTHDDLMESFRNPAISSGQYNRFLMTQNPWELLGGGGEDLVDPANRGNQWAAEPNAQWLSNKGYVEWTEQDLRLPGISSDLVFNRVYRGSVTSYDGPLGQYWDFNWNKRFYSNNHETPTDTSDDTLDFYDMGRIDVYTKSGSNWISPPGRYDTLQSSGVLVRTDRYGIVETYANASGAWYYLQSIEDPNGNLMEFQYSSGHIIQAFSNAGFVAQLYYDANGYLTRITDYGGSRDWRYIYESVSTNVSRLVEVSGPPFNHSDADHKIWEYETGTGLTKGRRTKYYYNGDGRLESISLPKDSTGSSFHEAWKWVYDGSGNVVTQFINGNPIYLVHDGSNKNVTVTDRESNKTIWKYDTNYRITKRETYYDSTHSWDTTWNYDSNGEVLTTVFPKGNRVEYAYDSKGNVASVQFKKDGSDTTPIQWSYTYASIAFATDKSCSRLSTLTDPNARTWDYDYDLKGNLTKKTAPAVTLPDGIATANKNSTLNTIYDGTISETWAYDEYGNVTSYTDAMGTVRSAQYQSVGTEPKPLNLTKYIEDPGATGIKVTHQWVYDGLGKPVTYVDPTDGGSGTKKTYYEYNSMDELISVIEPAAITRQYYHDLNGNIVKTTDTDDNVQGTDDFVSSMAFDHLNNITELIVDQDASTRLTTTYEYDKNDRLTKLTAPGTQVTQWSYDVRDLHSAITRKAVSSADDAITTFTFDTNGNRTTITDPRGYASVLAYDGYDRVTRVTRPEGNYRTLAYDAAGNVTDACSYNSGATKLAEVKYAYDQANRHYQTETLAKKADLSTDIGDGWQTRTLWRDEKGNVLEVTGDGCGCALNTLVYDALERLVTIKDAMPWNINDDQNQQNLVIRAYDLFGNLTKVTQEGQSQDPVGNAGPDPTGIEDDKDIVVEYQYDVRHRMTKQRDKLGTSTYADTVIDYGKRDQVTQVTDGAGRATKYEYNERLWPTKEWVDFAAGDDVITEHLYDVAGRKITYKATNSTTGNQSTIYEYDPLWRLVTTTWPDGDISAYTYDKASNRLSYTDPNGTERVAQYDKNNRLTLQNHTLVTNVVGATQLVFDYDGLDRLTGAESYETSPTFESQLAWTYNTFSRIETERQVVDGYNSGNGRTFTHAWNVDGQRTSVTYPTSGQVVSFARDELDRVDKVSLGSTEVVDYTFSGDRVLRKAYPGSKATFTYDDFGRLTDILHEDTSSGNDLAEFAYGYDGGHQAIWNKKQYYNNSGTQLTADLSDYGEQYEYDDAGRLVSCLRGVPNPNSGSISANFNSSRDLALYTYDQTGNRLSRRVTTHGGGDVTTTYAYNEVNEMTTEAGTSQAYTDNGTFSGSSNTYKYEHADRLARATSGGWTYKYHYDALGRLIQRDHSTSRVRFYYDGLHIVEQNLHTQGEDARKLFVFGPQIDELLLYIELLPNPDEHHYAHSDRLGSIQVFADVAGNIEESYRYKEFGETTIVNSSFAKLTTTVTSPIGNPHRYTGRRQDIQVGSYGDDWYDYRARVMRPSVGRFLQRDPIKGGRPNLYSYTDGDPINWVDPMGEIPWNPFEVAMSIWDLTDVALAGVFGDEGDFQEALSWWAVGFILPGGAFGPKPGLCKFWDNVLGHVDEAEDVADGAGKAAKGTPGPTEPKGPGKTCPPENPDPDPPIPWDEAFPDFDNAVNKASPPGDALPTGPPSPDFVAGPNGPAIPVPSGSKGPTPTRGDGFQYLGGSGGHGLHPDVTGVRIMGKGTASYMNKFGQGVHPFTGKPISKSDPMWHISWKEWSQTKEWIDQFK